MKTIAPLCALAALAASTSAAAQVTIVKGISTNTTTTIDFDAPPAPAGPISGTSTVFTANGIASVNALGGAWAPNATPDALTAASNVNGQALVFDNGALSIAGAGDPLDQPMIGDGIEFVLSTPVDEFGLTFVDQIGFYFEVELLAGVASLGSTTAGYDNTGFPVDGVYFRGPSAFDTVRITFPTGTGGVGFDTLTLGNGPSSATPVPDDCVETFYWGVNGGSVNGAVYFNVTAVNPTSISSILTNYGTAVGDVVGLEIYTTPLTHVGKEDDISNWTLAAMDNGNAIAEGEFKPTPIDLASPLMLPAGTTGLALVAVGSGHSYTNGFGNNQSFSSGDGNLTINAGTASNVSFTGPTFDPRVWNGRLCTSSGGGVGMPYCNPVNNSTGVPSSLSGAGSVSLTVNNLTLSCEDMPLNAFGYLIVSQTQGNVPMAGTSIGTLCLGGAVGRYIGPGEIMNSGATGRVDFPINVLFIPQPTGFVNNAAGDTWNFQTWHRDVVMGSLTSNFSNGLEITFAN